MKIESQKVGNISRLHMDGRFDASWCEYIQGVLDETIRSGEHHIELEMSKVPYLSSAGIRLLITAYRQLHAIDGTLSVVNPSETTAEVLALSGLNELLQSETIKAPTPSAVEAGSVSSASAEYEVYGASDPVPPVRLQLHGEPSYLNTGYDGPYAAFEAPAFVLGVGALGDPSQGNEHRMGEMLGVAGTVAYQPTDGANQIDYMISSGGLKAKGPLLYGLQGDHLPTGLLRFEAKHEEGVIGLAELSQTVLEQAGASCAVMVLLAEVSGLIGAALRQSPALAASGGERLGFPEVRDWLSFSSERIHRDSTALIAGVVAKGDSVLKSWMRPMDEGGDLAGHLHAAVFPYRPLRKGRVDLAESVGEIFEEGGLQSVLHLLADTRELVGAGESELYRGACWYAPVSDENL